MFQSLYNKNELKTFSRSDPPGVLLGTTPALDHWVALLD